jgi:beta-glucosidase
MANSFDFPEDFLFGTAIAAHQVEGDNVNSDWWRWEQSKPTDRKYPLEPSGNACDFWHRYEEDFDLCQKFNTNAIRLSIEWARIQPKEGEYSQEAIEHYKKILQAAKQRGLKTFVTLHHFTNPIWFADRGGWASSDCVWYFTGYAKSCAELFGGLVDAFITINEPQVYALMAYTGGMWPPNKTNPWLSYYVQLNLIRAHRSAYEAIKKVTSTPVGIAKNIVWYETDPFGANIVDRTAAAVLNYLNDTFFLVPIVGKLDFLGLNYYFTNRIRNLRIDNPTDYVSDLGWWINPGGLGHILQKLKKYNLPIYITENGLADAHDSYRTHFLRDMLIACGQAILSGVDVRGYFHWSLMDNYEWHQGFWPRFGLVEIDRENELARKPRDSFYYYALICKNRRVEV